MFRNGNEEQIDTWAERGRSAEGDVGKKDLGKTLQTFARLKKLIPSTKKQRNNDIKIFKSTDRREDRRVLDFDIDQKSAESLAKHLIKNAKVCVGVKR